MLAEIEVTVDVFYVMEDNKTSIYSLPTEIYFPMMSTIFTESGLSLECALKPAK
jgi:hypothetical protein